MPNMLLENSEEIIPERKKRWSLSQNNAQLLMYVGDGSKVWCHKEQYCIQPWNVKSTNQVKLEVVKEEMARENINILGISELKRTGMGEFNSDDHYIYYHGWESLRRNGVAITVNSLALSFLCSPTLTSTWLLEKPKLWLDRPLLVKKCLYFSIHCLGWS